MRCPRIFAWRFDTLILSAMVLTAVLAPTPRGAAPGDLDPTFGSGGAAILAVGVHSSADALAVQSDGKILAAGYIFDGSLCNMAIIRLDSTGALDPTFGSGGVVSLPAGLPRIPPPPPTPPTPTPT